MKPTLALSMIVRDAENDLSGCLESVCAIADEIVIADTGSKDSTIDVARQYGARVVTIPWEQDFSRARNLALEHVRTDWVLVLDADERLDPAAVRLLPPLLERTKPAGYLVTIRNYVQSLNQRPWGRAPKPNDFRLPAALAYPAYVEHENVRLFRRHPDIYFVGRVHETVGCRIQETGKKLETARFLIHHFGLVADTETLARKSQLYREMGRQKIKEMQENAQAYFELGLIEFDSFHNVDTALVYFERACNLNPSFSVAWFFAGLARIRLGHYTEALRCLKNAELRGHAPLLVAEAQGDALYNLGQFEAARIHYRRAIQHGGESAILESKIGLAEVRGGLIESGWKHLSQAIVCQPAAGELYDRLIAAGVWLGRMEEAAQAAERKLAFVEPHPECFLRAASIWAEMGHWQRSAEILRDGMGRVSDRTTLQQAFEEVLAKASPS